MIAGAGRRDRSTAVKVASAMAPMSGQVDRARHRLHL
jgi:hypothetical protein